MPYVDPMELAPPLSGFDFEAAEAGFTPFTPEIPPEESIYWGAERRLTHLNSLPAEGFTLEQHAEATHLIVATGLPVHNLESLHRRPNQYGSENWLGSWGYGSANFGEFSLYDLLYSNYPEQKLAVSAHEGFHANTPLNPNNDHLHGGEANRQAAEAQAWDVMGQSLKTKTHLNGYHASLIEDFEAGDIDEETLAEETWAIMGEMALTDRNGLLEVQQRQLAKMDDINRQRRVQGLPPFVKTTLVSPEGATTLQGVDRALSQLIQDIHAPEDILAHIHEMKASSYSPENLAIVTTRELTRGYDHQAYLAMQWQHFIAVQAMLAHLEEARRHSDEAKKDVLEL